MYLDTDFVSLLHISYYTIQHIKLSLIVICTYTVFSSSVSLCGQVCDCRIIINTTDDPEQVIRETVLSNFWHSFCGKMRSIKLYLSSAVVKASLLLRCGDVEMNPGPLTREGKVNTCMPACTFGNSWTSNGSRNIILAFRAACIIFGQRFVCVWGGGGGAFSTIKICQLMEPTAWLKKKRGGGGYFWGASGPHIYKHIMWPSY